MIFTISLFKGIEQSAFVDNIYQKLGERLSRVALAFGDVCYHAAFKVDLYLVARFNAFAGFAAFDYRQTYIDRVAVENSCERSGDNAGDAARLYRYRRVFSRRAAAEVLVRHHDVARFDVFNKFGVDVLHAVGGKLLVVGGV